MLNNFPDNFRRDDEEVLNEFRQKQVNFDLEERKNEIDNSRSLFIGALAGLAMAGVVGWFVLAPRYQNAAPEDVPVITRPQTPVKIQPSDPGDVELASQERTVYDIIEKKTETQEQDQVVVATEQPDGNAIEKLAEAVADSDNAISQKDVESLTQNVKKTAQPVVIEKNIPSEPVAEVKQQEEQKTAAANLAEVKNETPKAESKPEVKEEPKKTIAAAQKGNWQVQLMSSPNRAAVEKSWLMMSRKYKVLKNLPHEIESADLGAKGTFYRLKAGAFSSKAEAAAACSQIKSAGGSCFTAKK
ncbi:MAG: SPOR domain-containing protein [Azospirillum sp.]|nr:SPOR domain-containing protein [Azospirillum sp.]